MSLCFRKSAWFGTSLILNMLLCLSAFAQTETAPDSTPSEVSIQVLKASLSQMDTLSLNLEEALRIAMAENQALKAAQDQVNEARARYQTRLAEFLPNLQLTYNRSHYVGAIQGFGNEIFQVDRRSSQPQLLFRFPVFQGGRRFFQARSARQALEAQRSAAEGSAQQTLHQTALNYYELKRRLAEITIAQKQVEETQAQLELNRNRMEAGAGTRLDVMQSEAQHARARQQLLEAVRASESAALRLNELLNLSVFVHVAPEEIGQQMQTLVPANTDLKSLLALAVQNRPELKTIAKQLAALLELRKVAWSAVLPEVAVQARLGGVGTSLDSLRYYDETAYGIDFNFRNLALPALGLYRENSAQIAALRHQLTAQERTIERELSDAYLQTLTRRAQIDAAHTELAASEQALADAVERLREGVGRNIDVIDAETSVTSARTNLNTTILAYNQAQVELVYQLGLASIDTLTKGIQLP